MTVCVCSAERFGYPKIEKITPDTQLIVDWAVPRTDLDFLGNRKPLAFAGNGEPFVVRPAPAFSPCPLSDFRSLNVSLRNCVISFEMTKFNAS